MASVKPAACSDPEAIDRSGRRNWVLLVVVCVTSTLGLALAVLPILEQRIESPWPWKHTEVVLVTGLLAAVLTAVLYLTQQQRTSAALHREVLRARERVAERMRRQNARLEALLKVSRIMATETHLQAVFDSISQVCLVAFDCQQVSLMLLDGRSQELVVRAASGHANIDKVIGSRQKVGEGIAGYVAARSEAIILGPGGVEPDRYPGLRTVRIPLAAAMVVPILVRDEMVGVLNVASKSESMRYDDEDLQALKVFAENVGTCIRHAEQAEWMRQMIHKLDPNRQGLQAAAASRGQS